MECLRKLFKSCRKPPKPIKDTQISPTPVSDRTLNLTPMLNQTAYITPYTPDMAILTKVPSAKNLARVNSQKDITTIQSKDYRTKENKTIKYNCPICLKYYNTILVTNCCHNYICHFCIEQMNEKTANEEKREDTHCPFCECKSLILEDVDPEEKLKKYTDSPASTFGGGKPFLKASFKDAVRDVIISLYSNEQTPEFESNRTSSKHKQSKSINSFFGGILFARRKSEGTIHPVIPGSNSNNQNSVLDSKTKAKEIKAISSENDEEEESVKIFSARKLKSAILPKIKSPQNTRHNCDTFEDSQNTQI